MNAVFWLRDVMLAILIYAASVLIVIAVGHFLSSPKGAISLAPIYSWLALITRPDIIVTMIGVAFAMKYVSQAPWAHSIDTKRR